MLGLWEWPQGYSRLAATWEPHDSAPLILDVDFSEGPPNSGITVRLSKRQSVELFNALGRVLGATPVDVRNTSADTGVEVPR